MGILLWIREHLKQRSVAGDAFIATTKHANVGLRDRLEKWRAGGLGVIEDSLVRVNAFVGPNRDYQLTGHELFVSFVNGVYDAMVSIPGTIFICIFDDQKKVPTEKRETQHKRAVQCKHEPYPLGTILNDAGVAVPGEATTKLVDVRRIMHSRHLRRTVWEYFCKRLAQRPMHLLDGSRVVIEYDAAGPHVFELPYYGAHMKPLGQQTELAHDHGEFDMSWPYWAVHHLKGFHTIIRTIDTDIIPVALLHLHHREDEGNDIDILWEYKNRDAERTRTFVDLRKLKALIQENLQLSPVSFAFYCILNGTDFVKKEWLTHFIPPKAVLEGVQHFHGLIDKVFDPNKKHFEAQTEEDTLDYLRAILAHIYYKCDGQAKRVMQALEKQDAKAMDIEARALPASGIPQVRGQRTLYNTLADQPARYVPEWKVLYKALARVIDAQEEVKKEEAKAKRSKKRKQPGDDAASEPSTPKRITTRLRPPDEKTLKKAAERIRFNLRYWATLPTDRTRGEDSDDDDAHAEHTTESVSTGSDAETHTEAADASSSSNDSQAKQPNTTTVARNGSQPRPSPRDR